ncbi:MAG: MBL fold metallo-hydrolase [Saprospiraceae bacterium]|nr:MBL fold metallo-hydrolase [Saprospiraceae bacterium]
MKITLLGTGTSQGIPVIGCRCTVCTSDDPRDDRLRTSALISIGEYNILIDAGPDFRQQMLIHKITHIDAILLTHEHNDHIIGLDDIRPFNFRQKIDMPIYGQRRVLDDIRLKFAYIFVESPYPGAPRVVLNEMSYHTDLEIFPGIIVQPIHVMHGTLPILGYRIGNLAYITDASDLDQTALKKLVGLDILILNALQHRKHYSHFSYDEAIIMAQNIQAEATYFTHMSHEMGLHADMEHNFPEKIFPAYDGLVIETKDVI